MMGTLRTPDKHTPNNEITILEVIMLRTRNNLEETASAKRASRQIAEDDPALAQRARPHSSVERARQDPNSLTTHDVTQLQRTLGNQFVARLMAQRAQRQGGQAIAPRPGPTVQRWERATHQLRFTNPSPAGDPKRDNVIQRSETTNLRSRGVPVGYVTYLYGGKKDIDKVTSAAIRDHYKALSQEDQTGFIIFEQVYNYTDPSQKKKWFRRGLRGVGEALIRKVLQLKRNAEHLYVTGAIETARAWYAKKGFAVIEPTETEFHSTRAPVEEKVTQFESIENPETAEEWLDPENQTTKVFYKATEPVEEWS